MQNRIRSGDRWHRNSQLDRHDVVIYRIDSELEFDGGGSNLEIKMGIVNAHMPHMLNARNLGLDVECMPNRVTHPSSEGAARIGEEPDPAYWTAYDLHMIERDARAMRRAYMYSMIATYGVRLSQLIANSIRALWKKRR